MYVRPATEHTAAPPADHEQYPSPSQHHPHGRSPLPDGHPTAGLA